MAMMNEKDYYAILGVSKDADAKEIQKAFQQKARKLHPDINKAPDAEERFKEVSEAYAVLSDDAKRARYDAMRSGGPFAGYQGAPRPGPAGGAQTPGGFPFDGFPFGGSWGPAHRSAAAYNPETGADVVIDIDLNAQQARDGARKGVRYRRYETCEQCSGTGSISSESAHACPSCGGTGSIDVDMSFLFGGGRLQMVCPECGGTGRVVADPCPRCDGTGRRAVVSEAVIGFAAGTHDGDVVRMRGMGHAGTNGAPGGDLVGRAHVAAERLEGRARTGFYLAGFCAPFLVSLLITGMTMAMTTLCAVPFALGVLMVVSDDVLHRSVLWWRRGAVQFANGFGNGVFFAVLLAGFSRCSQSMTGPSYRMM
ncbi:heat shock protein DnaJ domain protein [Coriobacterium glomerans PW2]|uniref:Chaperone protein DnaJ n=1 Tax=Coriobacterium glomerans (strain ATCC 49209 / DSM 20642 / JCM 10262 / PW2) TaxID=700015 RepID=F2N7Q0_CORGP|nr:DnaJ domain-containing protein [Coriobacterium glomerans]AEB06942.1 heat shock protein DnaJ domain protein [Coriobacterium glomerans PW2]